MNTRNPQGFSSVLILILIAVIIGGFYSLKHDTISGTGQSAAVFGSTFNWNSWVSQWNASRTKTTSPVTTPPVTSTPKPSTPATPSTPTAPSTGGSTPAPVTSASGGPCSLSLSGALERSTTDRPDDTAGYQVHIVYAVPSDGADRSLDSNGTVSSSVANWEKWFCDQTDNAGIKLDTYQGKVDVTFLRLNATNATIASKGAYMLNDIKAGIKSAGLTDSKKLYEVYYDGGTNNDCGYGAWPPSVPGHTSLVVLQNASGRNASWVKCQNLSTNARDMDAAHEILHTIGIVATCAPHQASSGHVSDSKTDLMTNTGWPTNPKFVLDYNHDDYYKANISGCVDLSKSVFLNAGGTEVPAKW